MAKRTPFNLAIARMRGGVINQDLTDKMEEVIKAVRETGKQGTVTLTLKIKKLSAADEDRLVISPIVASNVPQEALPDEIVWSTADGDMLLENPTQTALDLAEVPDFTQPIEKVNS